jgi:hypothetical protein
MVKYLSKQIIQKKKKNIIDFLSNEYKDCNSRLSDYDIGIRHEYGPEEEVEREKGRVYYLLPLDKN